MKDNYNNNDNYRSDELFGENNGRETSTSYTDEGRSEYSADNEKRYDSNSYSFASEASSKSGHKGKANLLLKCTVAALAIAVIGAGVVKVYKFLNASKNELIEFSGDNVKSVARNIPDPPDEKSTEPIDDELPSLIELAARSDAKPIPDIVDSIMPSVVGVASSFEYTPRQTFSIWGWSEEPQTELIRKTGTGFIITDDGYIVTNAHVVYDESYDSGEAVEVKVLFSDETEHEANIIAFDPETDIAVLKVDETKLKPAVLGDSDELRVGELVIAVGNPLGFDLFGTVTSGIVSALNRKIDINEKKMNLIQTDAAINNGNSGGPLLNSCGQVIGINSAKMSSSYSSSASIEGLCFAIPIKEAKVIIDDLINYSYVTGRPNHGIISTRDITEAEARYWNVPVGVYVMSLQEGGAAALAGVQIGDIIIDIDGKAVSTAQELNDIKNEFKAGDTVSITVSRNGQDIRMKLTLQEDKFIPRSQKQNVKRSVFALN
ncbi:MAG: trypsin-like peptidase domain-containing protein [Ruminococcus sp.]|uniref:S1C family serine protease n=1 Tax=Ruminococcus sp. TaxID=41978 RepID=UPI0025FB1642|nr:trypsin-like peptidase domain-containing protein [Ruminococcus sp.]MBR5682282.1 trypsin-like peptidase domain-containing protein [Ruminococcus sp.]